MDYLPLAAVLVYAYIAAWWLARHGTPEIRRRRALRTKVMARKLKCPLCQSPLPAWDGAFDKCRGGGFTAIWGGGDGAPVGSMRIHCATCDKEVWIWVHPDGSVVPHFAWLWDNSKRGDV
jgi:hypothetical protein